MKKRSLFILILVYLISISISSGIANAYWIWTPETKKFVNPKYAVKDSPKEQFYWAMSFYKARDYQRAANEFDKLVKQYEFSDYASKSQYYEGLCYENMNKYYLAYQNYQKAIDNFPHLENTDEILAREFMIANLYLDKPSPKVLGTDIMAPLDRAVEIFKKVVENAPYGKFAEESQFKLGEALKKSERYEEAVQAFHKIVEDYPKSKVATQAMYEESYCAYKASLKPAYDAAATDNAIKTFEKFTSKNKDANLAKNAESTMKRLKDNVAEKSFKAAQFYESQGKTGAAILYYQDVIDTYPDSSFVDKAKAKIEELKAGPAKKTAKPIDQNKKKPERIVREKKPWNPLSFMNKKLQAKSETTVVPEASKKKTWDPLGFMSQKKKAPEVSEAAPAKEAPKKMSWNIFNLGAKKETIVKETPKKKAWKPMVFDTVKKADTGKAPETPVAMEVPVIEVKKEDVPASENSTVEVPVVEVPKTPVQVQETPKVKGWKPLNFDIKKESTPKENIEKKAWRPFNFESKKEPAAKESIKVKGWKPLYFGTKDETMAATNGR